MAKRGRPLHSKNKPKVKVAEEFRPVQVSQGEKDFVKRREEVRKEITSSFGVPELILGSKRGRPALLTEDLRCSCGRNLRYPLEEDERFITCRCGKKYTKEGGKQ